MIDTDAIIESFARHLMTAFDRWKERGFEAITRDPSDTFVFERAAEPGEWAVSGAFVFWNRDKAGLGQKQRVALRSGFLGIDSLGWSTLAIVTEATEAERQAIVARLAGQ